MSRYDEAARADKAAAELMALDPSAPRESLRDRVPYSRRKLATLTRSWLSASPEFRPQTVAPAFRPLNPAPVYPAWTGRQRPDAAICSWPYRGGWAEAERIARERWDAECAAAWKAATRKAA